MLVGRDAGSVSPLVTRATPGVAVSGDPQGWVVLGAWLQGQTTPSHWLANQHALIQGGRESVSPPGTVTQTNCPIGAR